MGFLMLLVQWATKCFGSLLQWTNETYRYGFGGMTNYLIVGVSAGVVVAVINILGEGGISRKDLGTWEWKHTGFVASRFLGGLLCWPLFLFLAPFLLPLLALVVAFAIMMAVTLKMHRSAHRTVVGS